ncbi:MAG TPA: hypothetical protein VMT34_06655 [Aggregatilineales bacterium]|nr:hypothetical protein [Aggregatilineales bacterium]
MRRSSRLPSWLILVSGVLILAACYFFYHGSMNFLATRGDIAASVTTRTVAAALALTDTAVPTIQIPTSTPAQPCLDFRVNVVKARVRDCPKDTCETVTMLNQYAILCVYGDVPDAPDWYRVNLSPDDPIPQIAYVSKWVVKAVHPTPRASLTPLPLPTVTPIPVTNATRAAPAP